MKRHEILRHPTKPINVDPDKEISELVADMAITGFQGRSLGEAVDFWTRMLRKKETVIWMSVAGAMVPAGMRKLLSYLIRRRMIDVLVTTGANIYHDAYEALGGRHFQGTDMIDDVMLRRHQIDRIYDVYADEKKFYRLDILIEKDFCLRLKDRYPYSSRQVIYEFGAWLEPKAKDKDSISISAYRNDVPVFVPAICDSSLGFSMMFANRRRGRRIIIDHMRDVDESSRIAEKSKWSGVVIVGGGVPKNFVQQAAVVASYSTRHDRTHNFAIQITMDMPQWGGLSGATLHEAQSWGKYHPRARLVTCHVDATIALPVMAHALSQRFRRLRRSVPIFDWRSDGSLAMSFERRRL